MNMTGSDSFGKTNKWTKEHEGEEVMAVRGFSHIPIIVFDHGQLDQE